MKQLKGKIMGKSNFSWRFNYKQGFVALLFCFMFSVNSITAQNENMGKGNEQTVYKIDANNKTITGIVLDEKGAPLVGANVILEGETIGTITNYDGKFEFPKKLKTGDVLVCSYVGYESKNIAVKTTSDFLTIPMEVYPETILCAVSTGENYSSKRSLWQKIKNIF